MTVSGEMMQARPIIDAGILPHRGIRRGGQNGVNTATMLDSDFIHRFHRP
jgi:hypothetical protein